MELNNLNELLQKYKKYAIAGVVILVVVIILLVNSCGSDKNAQGGDSAEGTAGATNETTEETNELTENSHASIERLVTKYLDCVINGDTDTLETITDELTDEDKAKIVSRATAYDSYENMVCYTKDGPEEDSYIVFLCYDIKLKDFLKVDTLVPDIQCLYVTPKDEDGNRYIRYSNVEDDEELQAYVTELEQDPEVKALYDDVKTRYQEALENDEALYSFMQKATAGSSDSSEEAVSEEQTEEAASEEQTEEETSEEQPEEAQEENVETGEAQVQNRETRVKESVNVRSEASTDAERIALAYPGDAITEIESYDNGWSKVEYKGQTGYVKTEFLE